MLSTIDIPNKSLINNNTGMESGELMISSENLINTYIKLTMYRGYTWTTSLPYNSLFYIFLKDCQSQHNLPEITIRSLFKSYLTNHEFLTSKQQIFTYYSTLVYFYLFK